MSVSWDYTALAGHYDKRADYSAAAIDRLLAATDASRGSFSADLGAGTGKLAIPLARRHLQVDAVEPNEEMRRRGILNSSGLSIHWHDATAEVTGLAAGKYQLVTFGSSFNVVDAATALSEVARILRPGGWLACMWNHRNLADPLQAEIEAIIRRNIPSYSYGTRRESPAPAIDASKLFGAVQALEEPFVVKMPTADYVEAWRSHATLQRQAGDKFVRVIDEIEKFVGNPSVLDVPYATRIWYAPLRC